MQLPIARAGRIPEHFTPYMKCAARVATAEGGEAVGALKASGWKILRPVRQARQLPGAAHSAHVMLCTVLPSL